MKSIIELQRALLADDAAEVKAYFDEADRRTGNEAMQAASEALGFKTAFFDGWLVTTGSEIGRVMGQNSDSAVRKMRTKYPVMVFSGGSSLPEFTKLRETFGLDPKDGRTVFMWWDSVLISALKGRTPEAERVQLYLLDCERALRLLGDAQRLQAKKTAWSEAAELGRALDRIRRSPNDQLTELYIQAVESALGKPVPRSFQLKLID